MSGEPCARCGSDRDSHIDRIDAVPGQCSEWVFTVQLPMNPHQKPQEDVVGNAAKFMRHDGPCAIIGGYGFCSCGRDAAYDALIAAPTYEAGRRDMREAAGKVAEAWFLSNYSEEANVMAQNIRDDIRALPTEPLGGEG